ncbi:protein-disulfide isomerase-like protein with CxxC motif [Paenibacillus qinlingensis]|uniref:Protein-disulfide isomerase-like protein with CxxC motif n=1 Tax=Paenibacillus qinlingensis TaxID=1837343 RepID=A0ABU1NUB4_9BACL|nr:protein-disulfide isomerase-like protein with CxxC motif [Paenibacillus qinlingensis]
MDSDAAAKGFSALQVFARERAYYLASSMQRAFYYEGKSLSDPVTYREIMEDLVRSNVIDEAL